MSVKKDNELIEARKQELEKLYEENKLSLERDHRIKNIPPYKLNKNGDPKLITLNEVKWTRKDVIFKILGVSITILIVAILIVVAYLVGERAS